MLEFFQKKNETLVKVILINGFFQDVSETKKLVYQHYKGCFHFGTFHLQHVSEGYAQVAKLSAVQKIVSFKQRVESITDSIPIHIVGDFVRHAFDRVISEEMISKICFDVCLAKSGNTKSKSYCCYSRSVVNLFEKELVQKTIQSVCNNLGSDVAAEMKRHIESEIEWTLNDDTDLFLNIFLYSKRVLIKILTTVSSSVCYPSADMFDIVARMLVGQNVNSYHWRSNIACLIYDTVSKNKENIGERASLSITDRFKVTIGDLKTVAKQLEEFMRKTHRTD